VLNPKDGIVGQANLGENLYEKPRISGFMINFQLAFMINF